MSGLQIAVLVYLFLSLLTTVSMVHKPRKTITPEVAAITVLFIGLLAALTIIFGGN